jgi:hypothetical protein
LLNVEPLDERWKKSDELNTMPRMPSYQNP